MKKIIGIDFGTTNSAASFNNAGNVSLINIGNIEPAADILKSVIYFDEEENRFYIGQQAIYQYLQNGANGRYLQSIKAFLPSKSFENTLIGRKQFKIEDLVALILREIKNQAENKTHCELDQVVLGRPVIFSEDKELDRFAEKRLVEAARLAGFKTIVLQLEPIAAALSFEAKLHQGDERKILVGDFGGGTSDFTIIKLKGGNKNKNDRKEDVLATAGIYVGGDIFDSRIMWERITKYFGKYVKIRTINSISSDTVQTTDMPTKILRELCQWHLIPRLRTKKNLGKIRDLKYLALDKKPLINLENLINDNYGYMLFRAVEKSKCELSSNNNTTLNFTEKDLIINEEIHRTEFELMIQTDINKIENCISQVMNDSQLKPNEIDLVVLTGGSSNIPLINKIFADRFGQDKIDKEDAFTSVALGLGLYGNLLI